MKISKMISVLEKFQNDNKDLDDIELVGINLDAVFYMIVVNESIPQRELKEEDEKTN